MAKVPRQVQKWIDIAKEDFDVAMELYKSSRYVYSAFLCQQAVEKILKAVIVFDTGKEPPYIHDLVILAEKARFDMQENDALRALTLHYIKGRYNEDRKNLPAHTKKVCKELLSFAEGVLKWSLTKLK